MSYFLHIAISIGHWLPMVLGYNLVFGKGKIFHFGPLGVSVATGYAFSIVLVQTDNYLLGMLAGALMATAVSCFFAWLSLRLSPDALGVMTIATHLAILSVILNWTKVTRGALGIPRIPRFPGMESMGTYAAIAVGVAMIVFLFFLWVDRSAFGRQLSALAEHEWHALSLGVVRAKVYVLAFVILGFCHFIGNVLALPYLRLIHPNDYQFPSFIFLIMTVVAGKPGSVWGVTLATVLLTALKEGLRFVPLAPSILGPVRLILFGVILFAAVWWRRDTLFPQRRTV